MFGRLRQVTLKECAPEIRRIDEVFGRLISLVARVGTVVDEKVTRTKWPLYRTDPCRTRQYGASRPPLRG